MVRVKQRDDSKFLRKAMSVSTYPAHILVNTTDKFSQNSCLKTHVTSVHESNKSFKCYICDYKFTLKSSLKRHIASVHGGKKTFKCEVCDYRCFRKECLEHTCCISSWGKENVKYVSLLIGQTHEIKLWRQKRIHDFVPSTF